VIRSSKSAHGLTLKRARLRFTTQTKVILGGVTATFSGPKNRSILFTFTPKRRNPATVESIEFELSRIEAMDLADWMMQESTKLAPLSLTTGNYRRVSDGKTRSKRRQ
jgi:hypothetical protein